MNCHPFCKINLVINTTHSTALCWGFVITTALWRPLVISHTRYKALYGLSLITRLNLLHDDFGGSWFEIRSSSQSPGPGIDFGGWAQSCMSVSVNIKGRLMSVVSGVTGKGSALI